MGRTTDNRVVVTSMGVVSSLGNTPKDIAESLHRDTVRFERPAYSPTTVVSPVTHFDVKTYTGRYKDARYLNRGAEFALAAALSTVRQSNVPADALMNAGLFVGAGPNMDIGSEFPAVHGGAIDESGLSALFLLRFLPNTAASGISRLCGIHGENITLGSACSASLMAIGEAFRKIKDGYMDLALAGGGDSRVSPGGVLAYTKARALWQGDEDPVRHYAPFDTSRKGFIIGEGGAFFLLENLCHAEKRGAHILAEITGYGCSMDGYNMTAPHPEGVWGEAAVRTALDEASIGTADVDIVSSHGTGTLMNDAMESSLIRRVFGSPGPCVMALKSYVGHLASACGALELALCLSCIETGLWPPIRNLRNPVDRTVRFLTRMTRLTPRNLILQNFGFGGQNSALVVRPWTP